MDQAKCVLSTPRITASKNTPPAGADQMILSDVRAFDGASEEAFAIPAINPTDDRRSDGGRDAVKASAIAPPARASRRGFLMNTMVSAASLATVAAVATPSIANATPAAVSFPDLVARFLPLRDRWKSETATTGELDEICPQLCRIATAIVNQPPKTLCDLGWQVEAFLTWADDFETIDDDDDSVDRMLKKLLANVRSLGGPLPIIPGIVPAPEIADPIFAAIDAHRSASNAHGKAAIAADVVALRKCGADLSRLDQLEAARDRAGELERDRIWDLIWTAPTTANGLAALLRYCRESHGINELVCNNEWEDALEWTMESAACALAGLPEPPMGQVVASLWNEGEEIEDGEEG